MAEEHLFVDSERISEVWAAFLTKLALKANTKDIANLPTTEMVATMINTVLTDYATSVEVAQSITTALENYMTESEVNSAIATAISGVSGGGGITLVPVETLPTTGQEGIMYLVPNGKPNDNNLRDEYLWVNNKWEIVGNTGVDLSNYWSKEQLKPMTAEELATILV